MTNKKQQDLQKINKEIEEELLRLANEEKSEDEKDEDSEEVSSRRAIFEITIIGLLILFILSQIVFFVIRLLS